MTDKQLVLGIFADEAAADAAVEQIKLWGTSYAGVKPGVIGVLVADGKGGIKEHKLGARSGGKGAGIGLVLAVVAPPTLLAGIAGGAILGHFHHQGLGLDGRRSRAHRRGAVRRQSRRGPARDGRRGAHRVREARRAGRCRRGPRGVRRGARRGRRRGTGGR